MGRVGGGTGSRPPGVGCRWGGVGGGDLGTPTGWVIQPLATG